MSAARTVAGYFSFRNSNYLHMLCEARKVDDRRTFGMHSGSVKSRKRGEQEVLCPNEDSSFFYTDPIDRKVTRRKKSENNFPLPCLFSVPKDFFLLDLSKSRSIICQYEAMAKGGTLHGERSLFEIV